MARVTIFEVAQKAGVSTGTVSRVLNGRSDVSPETRERVLRIVQESGYVPDSGARRLAKGQRELVGVAPFSENTFRSPYYSIMLDAIQERLFKLGYAARVLEPTPADPVFEQCIGFIVPGIHLDDPRPERLLRLHIPCVVVGRTERQSWVDIDNEGGIGQAMRHLFNLGHTRVAHITGSPIGQTTQARLEAYHACVEGAGLPVHNELIWDGLFTDMGAYRATRKAVELGLEFTAILAASDEMAVGAIAALQDAGLRVPLDVSVVGFDGFGPEAHAAPPLTTVRQPVREVGHTAADLLVETLNAKPRRQVILPVELVVRSSSAMARK
ncbi:MAG: LacI family DNA-binding transcriptional regulator [Meiothermus sp.]|nr:LacI family DNA-binding transcriptional regulator [Meiothermus sp.]